jgi:hypothetical protein
MLVAAECFLLLHFMGLLRYLDICQENGSTKTRGGHRSVSDGCQAKNQHPNETMVAIT